MTIRSIWAQATTRAIGAKGAMLWHLPEDMAFFRRATTGMPVVMGRRTWESFPDRFRPLPDRANIVVTRDTSYEAPGAELAATLEQGVVRAGVHSDEVWIIGGGEIYAQAMDFVDELWVTEVDIDVPGDAHAPEIGDDWQVRRRLPERAGEWLTSSTGTRYRFLVFSRAG